jgi:multimeric flavodoxin WrbA
MKVVAYNGSPRKNGNTAILLKSALDGAASKGAEIQLINLYDYKYQGCISCFSCKLKGGIKGRCAVKDELKPVLDKFTEADAVIFGSPIYFGNITSQLRSFMERIWFCNLLYTKKEKRTVFPKKINAAYIYTMNAPEKEIRERKVHEVLKADENTTARILRAQVLSYFSYETKQFDDYSKYDCDMFDAGARLKRHEEVFPIDRENCFEIGVRLAESI